MTHTEIAKILLERGNDSSLTLALTQTWTGEMSNEDQTNNVIQLHIKNEKLLYHVHVYHSW